MCVYWFSAYRRKPNAMRGQRGAWKPPIKQTISKKKNNQSRLLIGLILMCAPAPTLNTTCGLYSTHTRHSFLCIGGIVTLLPNVNSIRQNQITPKQSVKRYDSRVWHLKNKKKPNRNHMLIDVYIEEHGKRKETRLSCICKTHLLAHT